MKTASVSIPRTRKALLADIERRDAGVAEFLEAARKALQHESREAFSAQEVANLLGVSKRTITKLIDLGRLGSVMLPGTDRARRVTRAQLDAYVLNAESEGCFQRPASLRRR